MATDELLVLTAVSFSLFLGSTGASECHVASGHESAGHTDESKYNNVPHYPLKILGCRLKNQEVFCPVLPSLLYCVEATCVLFLPYAEQSQVYRFVVATSTALMTIELAKIPVEKNH